MKMPADRQLRTVENALAAVSLTALVLMMLVMVANVAMRYLFGAPLSWAVGFVSSYVLISVFFLGLPYTLREGAHVRVDLLHRRLPPRLRSSTSVVAVVLSAVFVAALTYGGLVLTANTMRYADIPIPGSSELSWPVWTSTVMVPIGAALTLLRLLFTLATDPTESANEAANSENSSTAADGFTNSSKEAQ